MQREQVVLAGQNNNEKFKFLVLVAYMVWNMKFHQKYFSYQKNMCSWNWTNLFRRIILIPWAVPILMMYFSCATIFFISVYISFVFIKSILKALFVSKTSIFSKVKYGSRKHRWLWKNNTHIRKMKLTGKFGVLRVL